MSRLACLLAVLGGVSGCDTFFTVQGNLVQCGSATPIAGATVVTATDPGAWGGPETETTTTDAAGYFSAGLNKPSAEAATVTFSKSGFTSFSRDFPDGLPTWPYHIDVCLDPAPPSP